MENAIELGGMDRDRAVARLAEILDGLAEGGEATLRFDADPAGILEALQAGQWGRYEWFPLGKRDNLWRVCFSRRGAAGGGRMIREFLTHDHRRCDELYARLESLAQGGSLAGSADSFADFESGMEHHFRMEEQVFFPAFETRTGMRQGPTTVMRMEHEQMRGIMKQMRQALEKGDTGGIVRGGTTLLMVMQQHNIKEEQMLYAMGDMHLQDAADDLVRQMQRVP